AAAVTRNTEEWGVYVGNPAVKKGLPSYEVY
ncbi:MAG: sugar O-acyltransferase, partial [Runella slithyformis]